MKHFMKPENKPIRTAHADRLTSDEKDELSPRLVAERARLRELKLDGAK